ncbi:MAG: DUF4212 domain-containing protein [Opitutae bacterium]|jgi:putative solute:sodium symporter small subunit|nr:DUF4212 domain-containing protein [Opitutae bacterium]MBT4665899.1 DUF4212 domain-containing protein [Opitutae bacterium]MBT5909499.1 DUF4212 domain-containing protein [Opitutae bacterium]MBT6850017.1 DUF4212 domain-containing protein [Opitutae bacterium]MBT7742368.1 DUF4212 domain-containing protein [Opitutae bacterium]
MSEENSSLKHNESDADEYWKANLKLMGWLLVVWFVVSYGCGILFVDELNSISLGGFKLGFWFAQQGAIYVFVALIFVYVKKMNKLDREFGVEEE